MTQQEKDKMTSEIHVLVDSTKAQIDKLKQDLSLLKGKLRQVKLASVDKPAQQ